MGLQINWCTGDLALSTVVPIAKQLIEAPLLSTVVVLHPQSEFPFWGNSELPQKLRNKAQ